MIRAAAKSSPPPSTCIRACRLSVKTGYFVGVGPLDKRVTQLPLPDEINGELMRFQVAHGVGHALGFPLTT